MVRLRISYAVIVFCLTNLSVHSVFECQGDVIATEEFVVNHDDFFFGMSDPGPVSATSLNNFFPTGLSNQGGVQIQNAHSLLDGFGNIRFTAADNGVTRLGIGLGNVDQTSIVDGSFINTQFEISGIDSDADAENFSFDFNANFLNIGAADAIGDFDIVADGATFSVAFVNEGLFRITIENSSASPSSIVISGADGAVIESINFRNITTDVANDELLVTSSRLLLVPVPEPTTTVLGCLGLIGIALRRRRSEH